MAGGTSNRDAKTVPFLHANVAFFTRRGVPAASLLGIAALPDRPSERRDKDDAKGVVLGRRHSRRKVRICRARDIRFGAPTFWGAYQEALRRDTTFSVYPLLEASCAPPEGLS